LFLSWGDGSVGNTFGDKDMCSTVESAVAIFTAAQISNPFPVSHIFPLVTDSKDDCSVVKMSDDVSVFYTFTGKKGSSP
jgi:hypothetical protein